MSDRFERRLQAAMDAVRAACRVCLSVQREMIAPAGMLKNDRSPVTVADYASQAVVCQALMQAFPGEPVVAEESASELRSPQQSQLRSLVTRHVSAELGGVGEAAVLDWIERGGHAGGSGGNFWTLDPIDGTKGFLRRQQYAVALAFIEAGQVVLGVLGCPNLPLQGVDENSQERGVILAAVRGRGVWTGSLSQGDNVLRPLPAAKAVAFAQARFCESVEAEHSSHGGAAEIARRLGVGLPPVRMDSQCKYAVVARGDASIYLRLPTKPGYREKIWDHAAGCLIVEEVGGRVTDLAGRPLDFSLGRELTANQGVIATAGVNHQAVLAAVAAAGSPA